MQDNFSEHIIPETLTNIWVINLRPNLTVHIQPNDQGIIHCFKAKYCVQFIQCAIDLYESGMTPSQIYEIDQLKAMQLANDAWNEVDTMTIRNCWQKAQILPNTNGLLISESASYIQPSLPISSLIHTTEPCNNPIMQAEKAVHEALDDLEATRALLL